MSAQHVLEARAKAGKTFSERCAQINAQATEYILSERSQGASWHKITSSLSLLGSRNPIGNAWTVQTVISLYYRETQEAEVE